MISNRTLRELERQHAERERFYQRRIAELEDKLLWLVGKPYNVPPIDMYEPEPEAAPIEFMLPDLEPLD